MATDFQRELGLGHLPTVATEPLALLADLHANLEAVSVVCDWLDDNGIRQAIVLGDLIGYGASPNAVLDEVRRRNWLAIRGNHEDILLDPTYAEKRGGLKSRARAAIEWTRQQLEPANRRFVEALPLKAAVGEDMIAVHGSLVDPRSCYAYIYDLSLDLNIRRMRELEIPAGTLIAHGHTHQPKIFRVEGEDWSEIETDSGPKQLDGEGRFFVNPGSVGWSRDGNSKASFMIWQAAQRSLELVRIPYDIESAAERIRAAGYSQQLFDYLRERY